MCPGQSLVYECITESGGVIWQEDGYTASFIPTDTKPIFLERFKFQLAASNQSMLVSTATLFAANSSDAGIEIECIEDGSTQFEVVEVAS